MGEKHLNKTLRLPVLYRGSGRRGSGRRAHVFRRRKCDPDTRSRPRPRGDAPSMGPGRGASGDRTAAAGSCRSQKAILKQ